MSEPILVSAKTGAPMIDVSLSTFQRFDAAGKIPAPIRLTDGTVRWRVFDLQEWSRLGCPNRKEFEALAAEIEADEFTEKKRPHTHHRYPRR